ncbi:hypothetical protein [Kiloniella majae]|uniref:hypothetical protein n=1 Tax=Kiloniella majae TaxID=1938558 RepID=UPI000F767557|nr:hypothetical protein [Kiloniella majae]
MTKNKEVEIRDNVTPLEAIKYNIISRVKLPYFTDTTLKSFTKVIESRQSRRTFSNIELEQLSPLFYQSSRTKKSMVNELGLTIEKRNTPSAGAMHTIDCIISKFELDTWYVYNSRCHTFDLLNIDTTIPSQFKLKCKKIIDCPNSAYLIWYICDLDRLNCKYKNAEFLALRESGALASTQSLIAENFDLAFCMLGLMGRKQANTLSNQRNLLGVGTAVVGGLTDSK